MASPWAPHPDWVVAPSEGWVAPKGRTPDGRVVADPGRRLLGYLLDMAIWWVPITLVGALLAVVVFATADLSSSSDSPNAGPPDAVFLFIGLFYVLIFGLGIVRIGVEAELVARRGQTWGMRALHLRVIDARTGGPVTRGRAWGRAAFASFVSGQLFGFGFWWSFFDDRKRALHDLVCATVVVDER